MSINIEKLDLRVAGLSRGAGERLAEAVVNQLAAARGLAATGAVGSLHIRLAPQPDQSVDELSRTIAVEIINAIEAAQ